MFVRNATPPKLFVMDIKNWDRATLDQHDEVAGAMRLKRSHTIQNRWHE